VTELAELLLEVSLSDTWCKIFQLRLFENENSPLTVCPIFLFLLSRSHKIAKKVTEKIKIGRVSISDHLCMRQSSDDLRIYNYNASFVVVGQSVLQNMQKNFHFK
jgi:hypothetical protein